MAGAEGAIYLDANILIYALEASTQDGVLAGRWLKRIDDGRIIAATSELTIVEVLPRPIAQADTALAEAYRRMLEGSDSFMVLPVSRVVLEGAVLLRAEFGGETPDAVHVATALAARCHGFLTNDTRLKLPPSLRSYGLADVVAFET